MLHLTLDEMKGNIAADSIDDKRKFQVKDPNQWTQGQLSGALQLSNSHYLDLGDACDFERSDAFSYGAWIRPTGNASGAPIARMDDGNKYRGYDLYTAGGQVAVHIINTWPENAVKVITNAMLRADQWQHVFATYDGSSKAAGIKIYIDGIEQPWKV